MNSGNIDILLASEAFNLQDDTASPPSANTGVASTSRRLTSQTFQQNQAASSLQPVCLLVSDNNAVPRSFCHCFNLFNIWHKI